ncbi:uncharacterized protein A4U43_C05F1890 [Asparagus officinalis]|uniref:Uncharacterized protein n=1 Tax=Asparagus officinalis TaxID=4686 RepID=A0A5P1ENN1_ASPOF|nr:uncharacterized protein A4U43_C05F1890 [Asparagus officinalis]
MTSERAAAAVGWRLAGDRPTGRQANRRPSATSGYGEWPGPADEWPARRPTSAGGRQAVAAAGAGRWRVLRAGVAASWHQNSDGGGGTTKRVEGARRAARTEGGCRPGAGGQRAAAVVAAGGRGRWPANGRATGATEGV